MEQIIRGYGVFLLDAVVVAILCVGIFKINDSEECGFFPEIGKKLVIKKQDYNGYFDFKETYQEESKKALPVIYFTGKHIRTGIVSLKDEIVAYDFSGNILPVRITSIKSMDGVECLEHYNPETMEMNFLQPGYYSVEIETMDEGMRVTRCKIRIPVNS